MIEAILGFATAALIILCAALYILADEADKKRKHDKKIIKKLLRGKL